MCNVESSAGYGGGESSSLMFKDWVVTVECLAEFKLTKSQNFTLSCDRAKACVTLNIRVKSQDSRQDFLWASGSPWGSWAFQMQKGSSWHEPVGVKNLSGPLFSCLLKKKKKPIDLKSKMNFFSCQKFCSRWKYVSLKLVPPKQSEERHSTRFCILAFLSTFSFFSLPPPTKFWFAVSHSLRRAPSVASQTRAWTVAACKWRTAAAISFDYFTSGPY